METPGRLVRGRPPELHERCKAADYRKGSAEDHEPCGDCVPADAIEVPDTDEQEDWTQEEAADQTYAEENESQRSVRATRHARHRMGGGSAYVPPGSRFTSSGVP